MVRTQRPRLAWVAGGVLLLAATGARAIYLDEDQNVTLRARVYSQAAIRTQNSEISTTPETFSGQLIQNRFFFNPEMDAKLTAYTNWMKGSSVDWLTPDDLRFRIAGWAFYDGIYDYGAAQFNSTQKLINASFNNNVPCDMHAGSLCTQVKPGGWFAMGSSIKLNKQAMSITGTPRFNDIFPQYNLYVPRSIYGDTARVNELYLSYSKGPFFLRVGRQSISWGESDTIALLDQSNPFDLTLAAPGFFQDIDEARIPLYTVRSSYNLFDTWGPLSSGFVEAYFVPGNIDATTATVPLVTASPYSPREVDPQLLRQGPNAVFPPFYQFVFFDHTLKQDWSSNRWGFRFQSVIDRFLTAQAWVYRTFPNAPVPQHIGFAQQTDMHGLPAAPPSVNINGTNFYIVSLEHKPAMVYGLAGTFFYEPLDGIVRMDAQFFEHEAGFIPLKNLRICSTQKGSSPNPICGQKTPQNPDGRNISMLQSNGAIPYEDVLRYELGFDRFFFIRALNPTNSFILSTSAVGSYNSSWGNTPSNRYRFNGQLKPGALGTFQDNFVNASGLDAQFQTTVQTDYLHGRIEPRLTLIQFVRGTFALHPTVSYRWNDSLLFQTDYQFITGAYQSLGFFNDRMQVSFRVTYQLN